MFGLGIEEVMYVFIMSVCSEHLENGVLKLGRNPLNSLKVGMFHIGKKRSNTIFYAKRTNNHLKFKYLKWFWWAMTGLPTAHGGRQAKSVYVFSFT